MTVGDQILNNLLDRVLAIPSTVVRQLPHVIFSVIRRQRVLKNFHKIFSKLFSVLIVIQALT